MTDQKTATQAQAEEERKARAAELAKKQAQIEKDKAHADGGCCGGCS